jgi:hypothetical protein
MWLDVDCDLSKNQGRVDALNRARLRVADGHSIYGPLLYFHEARVSDIYPVALDDYAVTLAKQGRVPATPP